MVSHSALVSMQFHILTDLSQLADTRRELASVGLNEMHDTGASWPPSTWGLGEVVLLFGYFKVNDTYELTGLLQTWTRFRNSFFLEKEQYRQGGNGGNEKGLQLIFLN